MHKLKITPDELVLDGKRLEFVKSASIDINPERCSATIDMDVYPYQLDVDAKVTVNRQLQLVCFPIDEIMDALKEHPAVSSVYEIENTYLSCRSLRAFNVLVKADEGGTP